MDQEKIAQAAQILSSARSAVALTGAGISRPSGIPDFRSASGLWAKENPLEVASLRMFHTDPQRFYNWLRPLLRVSIEAKPNPAHLVMAELEHRQILKAVVTQNIDGLHQQAGSYTVYELHGHMRSAVCLACGKGVSTDPLIQQVLDGVTPTCPCGGIYKPDIVLFDEFLPVDEFQHAQAAIDTCDVLLIAGTSLEVYPVADLPLRALKHGARLIIVNLTETYVDNYADVVLNVDVAAALPAIFEHAAFRHYE